MAMTWVESNKTVTILVGDHFNNVLVFGNPDAPSQFEADVKMEFWGEDWLSIAHPNVNVLFPTVDAQNDVITFDAGDRIYRWYISIPQQAHNIKWEIEFLSKPVSNIYEWQLTNWDKYKFFLQPEWPGATLHVADSGTWDFNNGEEYQSWIDPDGREHRRAVEVDRSYAVYHKTKRDHRAGSGKNYRTGKVLHILRPKAIDNNGDSAWCDIHIKDGIYKVTVPQSFLDTAVYPVIVNDTFGYWCAGASAWGLPVDDLHGKEGTPSSSGTVDKIWVHAGDATTSNNWKGVLVDETAETIVSDGVTPAGGPMTSGYSWESVSYSTKPSVTASTVYVVSIISSGGDIWYKYDAGAGTNSHYDGSNSYATPQDPTGWTGTSWHMSMYAEYTPSAAGANVPQKMHHFRQLRSP